MLLALTIRDIVLIERLDLALEPGLCVLTGETGAGKSILLDALGLALGARADRNLVRVGAERGSVSAVFALAADDPVQGLLDEHGIERDDNVVLRRIVGADGRSRGYVNDQPVGSGLLRRIGQMVVEVHGQHEQQGLLDAGVQRRLLDAFGGLEPMVAATGAAHAAWREARDLLERQRSVQERAEQDQGYWRHVLEELSELAPEAGEEERLVEARTRLMNREKLALAIQDALTLLHGDNGGLSRIGNAERTVERVLAGAGGLLDEPVAALERARLETTEAIDALTAAAQALQGKGEDLESIEERLFALRAAARKHRVEVEGLEALRLEVAERLALVEAGDERLAAAGAAADRARTAFVAVAERLSAARAGAAEALARAVGAELPPLRLDRARFSVRLLPLPEEGWGEAGRERVVFEVATNPGQEPGPLARIASGGELARLMLALKVVLARASSTPCLIFDEVDSGIGGATADAVGERLSRLAGGLQVLVVTHAPQVAARADHHWRVEKRTRGGTATVAVTQLQAEARREEVARMLAGATITEAARAAADSLITRSA